MKKIGLIGGMSWESSLEYYRLLNLGVKERLGGYHSVHCIMESVDFAEIERLQHAGSWHILCQLMTKAALNLEIAGADCIVLCTNTMHTCCEVIEKHLKIPFLHIARATAEQIVRQKLSKILLLGTKFTMEQDFFKDYLRQYFNIEVIIPSEDDRSKVHEIIYSELVQGKILDFSRREFQRIIKLSESAGAEGVILGCTEIPLLITQEDVSIPTFDTTQIHVEYALDFALA
ncbi:MAG: aspartate/glutamate racemase family protein [Flavobacteriaceae bacterium]|nr:aspartate/glutamate racemase family protein [Flavobacteriaceae bacterium]